MRTRQSTMRIALCAWMAVVLLMLSACGSQPIRRSIMYTVKAGDTIYSIAWKHGVDYHELASVNHIDRDYHINIGQVLLLPRAQGYLNKSVVNKTAATDNPAIDRPVPGVSRIRWQWPVMSNNYAATTRPNGGKGLMINGSAGQDIKAAAAGKVVYAGTGLLGYGQLLIIKHDETFLSAYGHTQTMFVHEGDSVNAGQKIASMGKGPNGVSQLYFEIRSNGSPLSPLSLLPQQ